MVKWFNYLRSERVPQEDGGLNEAYWLHHRSYARGIKNNPYLLANEWIAANLAWHIRVGMPPFAMMRKGGSARFFAALDFGADQVTPPDMNPHKVAKFLPREAAGVVLFDIWIANPDRHEKNLKVDNKDRPTRLEVFDHDCAIFGRQKNKGMDRLAKVEGRLGFSQGLSHTDNHKLAQALTSTAEFIEWSRRIEAVPDPFIQEICDDAKDLNVSSDESLAAGTFLIQRKRQLVDIVNDNRGFFKSISVWGVL